MSGIDHYIVAGCKPWNRAIFDRQIAIMPGRWHYVGSRAELTEDFIRSVSPRYIFFLHWSWKVPERVVEHYECVCFHMTDVPYGRGGSPLQNLIVRGHRVTKLTALRMCSDLDAGPVYLKEDLSLEGTAEEIYLRACEISASLIGRIIRELPYPVPQTGIPILFRRRMPSESEIGPLASSSSLYDFIRMLDADGYPAAFLNHQGFRYEFRRARLADGQVVAEVTITPQKEGRDIDENTYSGGPPR